MPSLLLVSPPADCCVSMSILEKIDDKLMGWLVKRNADGRPHLQKSRVAIGGLLSTGWYVWVGWKFLHGEWPDWFHIDGLILLPLHMIYTIRAWREVDRRFLASQIPVDLPKVEIPPARIVPAGEMPKPPRRERVRTAVKSALR